MAKTKFGEAFSTAAEKTGSGIDFLEAVFRERPDLRDKHVLFPYQGQKGYVVIIGDEVFKGPKKNDPTSEAMTDFETEKRYLTELKDKGLPIPAITTVGKDHLLIGMTLMPGVNLDHEFGNNWSKEQQQALAHDMVKFVIDMARALPLQGKKFAMHDDFWHTNMLIDEETNKLAGVIDFGKVAYKETSKWEPCFDFPKGSKFYNMLMAEFKQQQHKIFEDREPKAAVVTVATEAAATAAATATAPSAMAAVKQLLFGKKA